MIVSVVIPALDAATTIHECLSAIGAQTRRPDEIIVADNGSRDGTADLVRAFAKKHPELHVSIVDAVRRGPGPARNAGAATARGEILAFTDSDCLPRENWLAGLIAPIESGAAAASAGRVEGSTSTGAAEILQSLMLPVPERDAASRALPADSGVMTGSFAMRADAFRSIGGFDERLRWHEDSAIALALFRSGVAIAEAPAAIVLHRFPAGLAGLTGCAWKYGAHAATFFTIAWPRRTRIEITRWLRLDTAGPPGRTWIIASPDKVVLAALLPGIVHPALAAVSLLPLAYYYADLLRRASARQIDLGLAQALSVLALDLAYHAVLTGGRIAGSIRGRSLCL